MNDNKWKELDSGLGCMFTGIGYLLGSIAFAIFIWAFNGGHF